MACFARTGCAQTSTPCTTTRPASGRSRPVTIESVVVFPAPFVSTIAASTTGRLVLVARGVVLRGLRVVEARVAAPAAAVLAAGSPGTTGFAAAFLGALAGRGASPLWAPSAVVRGATADASAAV